MFSVDVIVFGVVFCAVVIRTVFEIRCARFSCDVVFAVVSFDRAYFLS